MQEDLGQNYHFMSAWVSVNLSSVAQWMFNNIAIKCKSCTGVDLKISSDTTVLHGVSLK